MINNAKNLFLAVIFSFFSLDVLAANHSTTFDERPICEASKGVWREFGNSCVDGCEHVFNHYKICPNAITFGCDCGEGRCWLDNKCIQIADYKKSYDEKVAQDEKQEAIAKKERDEKIKNDPQLRAYLYDIYKLKAKQAAEAQNQQNGQQGNNQNNNQNNNQASQQQIPTQPVQQVLMPPAAIPQTGQTAIVRQVPPAFIAQEKQKQQAAQDAGITPLLQDPKTGETIQLPVVPLPQ